MLWNVFEVDPAGGGVGVGAGCVRACLPPSLPPRVRHISVYPSHPLLPARLTLPLGF